MDFKESVKLLTEHIMSCKSDLHSEEATKTSLVLPFFQILGYDIFNTSEVKPELSCGKWFNKGKKVDYGIYHDGKLSMIIECKHLSETNLATHFAQLDYYFHALDAKFAILTNGITYQFYTDIDKTNKMDELPFLEIDLSNIEESQIAALKMFHKSSFEIDAIWKYAKQSKELDIITTEIKDVIKRELSAPSEDFARYFISKVYKEEISQCLLEHSIELVKQTIADATQMTSISSSSTCEIIKPYKESIVTVPNDSCMITETEKWNSVYSHVVSVYLGKMHITDAANRIHNLYNDVAQGSFIMYYYAYAKMLSGELHTRSISSSLRRILLDGIYNDYGEEGLRTALKAYLAHIKYQEKNGINPVKAKIIYEEYAQKII